MKATIVFAILLISGFSLTAQSLRDALYSGKLKSDTGTVVRKTDDLSTKIDTAARKPPVVETQSTTLAAIATDSIAGVKTEHSVAGMPGEAGTADNAVTTATPKNNTEAWKDYAEELTETLRTEVLPSKKIKSGSYSVLIEYEIGLDGQISVNNVSSSPESSFLDQQIRERITLTAPQMTPALGANGKPRKAVKKYMMTIAK